MKPHLIKIRQLWFCATFGGGCYGLGYTPLLAYQDWLTVRTINAHEVSA